MNHRFENDRKFCEAVGELLDQVFDAIDVLERDTIDLQLNDGGMKVSFDDGGVFLLSRQTPLHELWLSANYRAYHFQYQSKQWIERDLGHTLCDLLTRLFVEALGEPVELVI